MHTLEIASSWVASAPSQDLIQELDEPYVESISIDSDHASETNFCRMDIPPPKARPYKHLEVLPSALLTSQSFSVPRQTKRGRKPYYSWSTLASFTIPHASGTHPGTLQRFCESGITQYDSYDCYVDGNLL
uniref:Uncharacterized protein n=1 Tax=Kwoniella pini CBS 10737 TaxID=1296096 RepID=A0A1B9I108_9TREE|nr:uncharacterized protein I206_04920 [Kwoniella pini CBS 10737]OCF49232.1 hypothetical protein I206_04920 [Kwoniella pini CBS 10737]